MPIHGGRREGGAATASVRQVEEVGQAGGPGAGGSRLPRRAVTAAAAALVLPGGLWLGYLVGRHAPRGIVAPAPTAGAAPWGPATGDHVRLAADHPGARTSGGPPPADPGKPGVVLASGGLDLGDPVVVADDAGYQLYTSQAMPLEYVPTVGAAPKGSWGTEADALPTLPAWAGPGAVTAPDVHQFGQRWMLYFTAPDAAAPGTRCIGTATADDPAGPFAAAGSPLVCPPVPGSASDPRVSGTPGGTPYLVWVAQPGASAAAPSSPAVEAAPLTPGGTALQAPPLMLYRPDQAWQQGTVADANLVDGGGAEWLVYSAGGGFTSSTDAIGVAACSGPLGPCHDILGAPLLATDSQGSGPGDPSVLETGGQDWVVYNPSYSAGGETPRAVDAALLSFGPSGPYLATPGVPTSAAPAPAPPGAASAAATASSGPRATSPGPGTQAGNGASPLTATAGATTGVTTTGVTTTGVTTIGVTGTPAQAQTADSAGLAAVQAALSQLGVPYEWGGEQPGAGFDCSGLVQWAWAQAGVAIPRTAAAQYAELPHVPLTEVRPGDLLFYFNMDGDDTIDHVVMYVGTGSYGDRTIVQAPESGSTVSFAAVWTQGLVGAARP